MHQHICVKQFHTCDILTANGNNLIQLYGDLKKIHFVIMARLCLLQSALRGTDAERKLHSSFLEFLSTEPIIVLTLGSNFQSILKTGLGLLLCQIPKYPITDLRRSQHSRDYSHWEFASQIHSKQYSRVQTPLACLFQLANEICLKAK